MPSLRVTGTWSVASPVILLYGNGRIFAALTPFPEEVAEAALAESLSSSVVALVRKEEATSELPALQFQGRFGNTRVAVPRLSHPLWIRQTHYGTNYPNISSGGLASTDCLHPTSSCASCRCTRSRQEHTRR